MDNNDSENQSPNGLPPMARHFLWADDMSVVQKVIKCLAILCAILFVLDLILHRHAYVPGEGIPGFYAVVGFVAFTLIVLGATQLRRLILRNEHFYAPYSVDAESYPEEGTNKLSHQEQVLLGDKTVNQTPDKKPNKTLDHGQLDSQPNKTYRDGDNHQEKGPR